jgi:iron complex transport system permease protein
MKLEAPDKFRAVPVSDSGYRPPLKRLQLGAILVGLAFALLAVLIIGAALGPVGIDPLHSFGVLLYRLGFDFGIPFTPTEQRIIESLRLPRLLLAGLVGGSLAVVGAVFQALFRNPLADPGLTGVSSGGSLGAVLAIATGLQAVSLWTRPALAFVFAALTALLVYSLAISRGRVQLGALLLAGVAASSFTGACISAVLTFTRNNDLLREIIFWLLGGFVNRGWEHLGILTPLALTGIFICFIYLKDLNLMLAGEDEASSLGVNVPQTRLILLIVTAFITAGCVSVSGTISFVGLIVPHIARLLIGPNHRALLAVSLLGGAVFLMLADTLARLLLQPQELPVGVITAFLGAPFFLSLLYLKRQQAGRF